MAQRHDGSYRQFFSYAVMVEDLLRGFLLEPWLATADLGSLARGSEVHVTDRLDRREADRIWRLRRAGGGPDLYLLLEFQSQVDPDMDLRFAEYGSLLRRDLRRQGERAEPQIVEIVVYNGRQRWPRHPVSFRVIEALRAPLPEGPGPDNRVALLFELERSRTAEEIDRAVARLAARLAGPEERSLRRTFTAFLRQSLLPARFPGVEVPALADLEEVRPMLRETVVEWTQQWLEEGRQQGRQEGRQQGLLEGRAEMLARLLERRFGPLGAEVRGRLAGASPEELATWGDRLFTARSLPQVFGEDG